MRISPFSFVLLVLFAAVALYGDAKRPSEADTIDRFLRDIYLSQPTNSPAWAFLLEDTAVPLEELKTAYTRGLEQYSQQAQAQGQAVDSNGLKREILNNTLLSTAVMKKALEDGLFNDADARASLRLAIRQAIVQIYLARLAPKDTNRFIPSREEITDFYNRNREKFEQSGASADQIKAYIVNQLGSQKMAQWVSQQMEKTKEAYRIRRNETLLEKEGFGQ